MVKVLISDISSAEAGAEIPGSGTSTLAMELSGSVAENVNVYLLVYDQKKSGSVENRGKIKLAYVKSASQIQKVIAENGIEIVHSAQNRLYLQNIAIPIIQTAWYYPHNLRKRIKNELSRNAGRYPVVSQMGTIQWNLRAYVKDELSFRKATRIFAVTEALKEQLAERFGDKVEYVPAPINTELFERHERQKQSQLSALFVGKASHHLKGFKYLCEALKIVQAKTRHKLCLKLAGTVEPTLLKDLTQLCSVDYKGVVPRPELPEVYSESDFFVFPTLYEEFGYVVLEAMSCGVPVISTNIHSITELVGAAGILVPPRDSLSLAEAMLELIEDAELREELGAAARKRAVERFSRQVIGGKVMEEYSKVLGR
jgi:glycosyltransferase involved in cell wall biosynthesis